MIFDFRRQSLLIECLIGSDEISIELAKGTDSGKILGLISTIRASFGGAIKCKIRPFP